MHTPKFEPTQIMRVTNSLLLIGAGGHARSCIDVIEDESQFAIAGIVGQAHECGGKVFGYDVLGTDDDLAELRVTIGHALVGIGQIKDPDPRMRAFEALRGVGFSLPSIVSPRAYVSRRATLGLGTIVMHGAVVNAGAVIGNNCIINSLALVEHDVHIGDHSHISTGARLNGAVRIGEGTFVGSGAVLREGIALSARSIVRMGASVVSSTGSYGE